MPLDSFYGRLAKWWDVLVDDEYYALADIGRGTRRGS
jgi:hypothetical protein